MPERQVLGEPQNWVSELSCISGITEQSSYSPHQGLMRLAPQAGSLARVRDGCKCGHILVAVPLRYWSERALPALFGKHIKRYGALIKINVQRKFKPLANLRWRIAILGLGVGLGAPQHPRSLKVASAPASIKDLNHRMPGYFLMLPSASNCLR